MSVIIVAADVVNSTGVRFRYTQETAAKKIDAELTRLRDALLAADESLRVQGPRAGDSILLINGTQHKAIYRECVIFQAVYRAYEYERLALRIAITVGDFVSTKDEHEQHIHHQGRDIDNLHAIMVFCPEAGVVVSESMYSELEMTDYRLTRRFHRHEEVWKDVNRVFYISNGDYHPPHRRRRGRWTLIPQNRHEVIRLLTLVGIGSIAIATALALSHGWSFR